MTVLLHEGPVNEAYLQARKRHQRCHEEDGKQLFYKVKNVVQAPRERAACADAPQSLAAGVCCSANLAAFFSARRRLKKSDSWAEQASASTPPVSSTL